MNSRIIWGWLILSIGFGFILPSLFFWHLIFLWFYGIPLFILGTIILLNKKEDKIEEIKKMKGGK